MSVLASVLSAVFWGVIVLSVLVFVHEGGHFLAARAFGVRVTEFFLGMPSRLRISAKSRRFGTEYGVTPILLGGYNRICGMEGDLDELLAPALAIVQRDGRVLAVDLASELGIDVERAYALLAVLADMAAIRPYYDPERGETPWQAEYPAAFETQRRDATMLTEYDSGHAFGAFGTTDAGEPRPVSDAQGFFEAEASHTYRGKGFLPRVTILLAGPFVNIALAFVLLMGSLMIGGVSMPTDSNTLGGVSEGGYAYQAGLREGDTIVRFGSHDIASWTELVAAIDEALADGEDIPVAYVRDGQTYECLIDLPEGEQVDIIGVSALMTTYHPSFGEAFTAALSYVAMVGGSIAQLLMPQHTLEVMSQSSSIVGISAMASEAAASGLADLILFAAAVSVSLGFMNLLPIPPLDGGKILIEVLQLLLRRQLSTRAQNAVSYVGLAFFLFIFAFALRNDVLRFLG